MKQNRGDFFRKYAIVLVLVALCVLFTILEPAFVGVDNIMQILRNISISGIVAVGMAFCLIAGGLDLSVGTTQGFAVIVVAVSVLNFGMPVPVAVLLAIACGVGIGLVNGVVINELNVPPLIATLATMEAFRGVIYVVTEAKPIFGFDESFTLVGQGTIGVIPIPVIIFAAVFALGWLFLNRTTIGRYFYGVGSNDEVARLSGVNVKKIKYLVYALAGLLAAFSGVILVSRLNSGQPRVGIGLEFEVITAVVLGGVSITGGEGKLSGVLFGILIMGVLKNGLILTGVTEYYQMIITGVVLIAAVGFDATSQKRRQSKANISIDELKHRGKTAKITE